MLWFGRLSLGTRLTLLAVATLCPIVALTVSSFLDNREQRREQAIEDVVRYTESLAATLENFARDLDTLTQAAAISLGARDRIDNANSQTYLAALVRQNELYQYIFITDLQGRVIAQDRGDDTGTDLSSRPYIQALQAGSETTWSGRLDGIRSGAITVAYARVIREPDGDPRAYLVVAFYAFGLADRFPTVVPEEGHLVLVDENGQLVFSSIDPTLESRSVDLSAGPLMQTALAGQQVVLNGDTTLFDEGARVGSLVPIPSMNWVLGFTRSQEQIEGPLSDALRRDLGILALIGMLSVGALVVVSRQVTRPLAELARAVTEVKENQPFQPPRPTTDPDVARLQQAFLGMTAAVKEREQQLADKTRVLDTLERVGASLASSLDLERTVQAVTDAGTQLTEAAFGAFFYNVTGPDGRIYQLYALSGADRSAFESSGMTRVTALFGATLNGETVIRVADVTEDERYRRNPPHHRMPHGQVPVRSYLAVPVISPGGDVIGGLFFGHPEPGVFSERHEQLAIGIAGWAAIAFDNARLYRESQDVRRELVAANRTKDEFLSLVSHELRTPITVISVGAARLLRLADDSHHADRTAVLQDVVSNAGRLSELVQNLLVLARPGVVNPEEYEPMLIRPVVQAICEQFHERKPDRMIDFLSEANEAIVLGSPVYLEQTVINLLSNADKYSPEGMPIAITVGTDGESVRISVEDQGPGLTPDEIKHLFEPYFRGDEAKKHASGFGLGLAVCRRLVRAMGGDLHYTAGTGGGACFTIGLPLQSPEPADDDAIETSARAAGAI